MSMCVCAGVCVSVCVSAGANFKFMHGKFAACSCLSKLTMRLTEKRGATCRCCFSRHFAIDQTTHTTHTHTHPHTLTERKQQQEQLVLSDFGFGFSVRLIKNAEQQKAMPTN